MEKIEQVREYAYRKYIEKYGWFQINEGPDGVAVILDHEDTGTIEVDLDRVYYSL